MNKELRNKKKRERYAAMSPTEKAALSQKQHDYYLARKLKHVSPTVEAEPSIGDGPPHSDILSQQPVSETHASPTPFIGEAGTVNPTSFPSIGPTFAPATKATHISPMVQAEPSSVNVGPGSDVLQPRVGPHSDTSASLFVGEAQVVVPPSVPSNGLTSARAVLPSRKRKRAVRHSYISGYLTFLEECPPCFFSASFDTRYSCSKGTNASASNASSMRLPSSMDISRYVVLPHALPCRHCGAYKFYRETANFCCSSGAVHLAETILPDFIVSLITGTDARSKEFQNMIRTYNNHFAYSSLGIHCDRQLEQRNCGIYTVRVQGLVHHFLNDLLPPAADAPLSGFQFYFFDSEHQATNRVNQLPRLDIYIVNGLVETMEINPYTHVLRQLSSMEESTRYCIHIRSDPGLDLRVYNRPTSTEVAGIWIEDGFENSGRPYEREVRVYARSGHSHIVHNYYGCYDPLQYVLMFPNGEPGWHGSIPLVSGTYEPPVYAVPSLSVEPCVAQYGSFDDVITLEEEGIRHGNHPIDVAQSPSDPSTSTSARPKKLMVSCRKFYAYKLQMRIGDRSYLLRFGRLLQQYVVDMYIKLETMRLEYLRTHQSDLRTECYQGLLDSVVSGVREGSSVGTRVYLPPSFIGGPRDMRQRYLDSMALVQEFGRPDLFLTITCNPNWPEIKECLQPGDEAQNRPDLTARVFKAKLSVLHDKIMKSQIFGEVASLVHVIEFQKRGLPHAHFLIILKDSSKLNTPAAYDRIVCAELPDKNKDPYLYRLVVKHMMHGPCGTLNPANVCMREGRCKNHYPKEFVVHTSHGKGNYPIYRRRFTGLAVLVRGKLLDNRWVVPYNPTLLAEFDCHLNVEICCDIRVVKYLYKYVYKGHDKIAFRISPEGEGQGNDEIRNFQTARWVSPVEAVWRLYGFPLNAMFPAVLQLQIHLPNFQRVRFDDSDDLEKIIQDDRFKRTMLTEFFQMNSTNVDAQALQCCYKEFPKHFVWDSGRRVWRKRKYRAVVGRLATVNPCEDELYYLRILLINVPAPTSFQYLLCVNGSACQTYRESAYLRGLLHQDDDVDRSMEEASIYQLPPALRRLFATLLYYCKPSDPKGLFDKFYEDMAYDFTRSRSDGALSDDAILENVLRSINSTLESLGKTINDYRLVADRFNTEDPERFMRELMAERNVEIPDIDLNSLHQLNAEQKSAFDRIFSLAVNDLGGAFFLDGPGGTGKSFLYKVLLAHIRSLHKIAIVVATSGIAASAFPGGRTAHSRFKIPISGGEGVQCQVAVQSSEAHLLRNASIIIWDEAPMANKCIIESVDKLMQTLCGNRMLFGGKLIVFGGDFRQVLPVVKGGNRDEQIASSLISSSLWKYFIRISLVENMRARDDPAFMEYLMRIGNGDEPTNDIGQVAIPMPMVIRFTTLEESLDRLVSYVYPDLQSFSSDPLNMMKRGILCPKNEFVDDINTMLIDRMPGEAVVYISDDRATNVNNQGDYIDYLNSLEPKGLPQHKLVLKVNCPIVLLRNINPIDGMCNGTRLICKVLRPNVVGAIIASGQFMGKLVWIPRIPLAPNPGDNKYLIPFVRRQLPIRLCFAMTINKAQGQTLDYVGIYLKQPVFGHGQLYVALSRARLGSNVKLLILPPTCNEEGSNWTENVVYKEVLTKASGRDDIHIP